MADRELSSILTSGEIASINLGGTDTLNAVPTKADLVPSIIALGTASALTQQTLVAGVPEVLTWFTGSTVISGTDFTFDVPTQAVNFVTDGVYKLGGTIYLTDGNANNIHSITAYINGSPSPMKSVIIGDGALTFVGAASMTAADVFTLWIESDSTAITVQYASVVIEKI